MPERGPLFVTNNSRHWPWIAGKLAPSEVPFNFHTNFDARHGFYIRASFVIPRRFHLTQSRIASTMCGLFHNRNLGRVLSVAKRRPIMPTHLGAGQNSSQPQGTEGSSNTETGIATLWLVFYVVALGVAVSSPLISRAIEFAALTAE